MKIFAEKKHFIPTFIVSGFIMLVAGIIFSNIVPILKEQAIQADQANGVVVPETSHLFEIYLGALAAIMTYIGLGMLILAGLWLLYFLFTMEAKPVKLPTNKNN